MSHLPPTSATTHGAVPSGRTDASVEAVDVLVVGAGPAGLASAACLKRQGIEPVVVDRADSVASTWRGHYERLHLHTAANLSTLPFQRWPKGTPRYPSRQQVVDALDAYQREHGVTARLGVTVQSVEPETGSTPAAHSERWRVTTTKAGQQQVLSARVVVMASGCNRTPRFPNVPGLDAARAAGVPVVHTAQYKNAAPYAGKRVLVVGCGNSGAEIALDLAEHRVDVALVMRGPVHVVPRDMFGRPTQETSVLLERLPIGLRDALTAPLLHLLVGDLRRYGITRPKQGVLRTIADRGRVPLIDVGTIAAIKAGSIAVVPGLDSLAVDAQGAAVARFADGSTRGVDAVVFATGYTADLAPLFPAGLDVDALGRPRGFGVAVQPGLYFVGLENPPTGNFRAIAKEAQRMARDVAAQGPRALSARSS